jgi:hypothetical protein
MIKLKDLLKESHVWERKFGEKLPTLADVQRKKLQEARKYKLGDGWKNDFDYEGMLKMGTKSKVSDGVNKLEKLFNSFEDVNYHTVSTSLWEAIISLKDKGPSKADSKKIAASHLKKFNKLCKDELKIDKLYGKFS